MTTMPDPPPTPTEDPDTVPVSDPPAEQDPDQMPASPGVG